MAWSRCRRRGGPGAGGRQREHLEVGGLEIGSHSGQGPGSQGLAACPDSSLFTSARLSQCHACRARNNFQESGLRELIGSCSERAFTVTTELWSKVWASLSLDRERNKQLDEFFQPEKRTRQELEVPFAET